ncbi:MAG TPA: glycoside hydrolase [Qipengyuania sp.]|nr:glycoside hydrolase [Qipengyuania sp.]
MGLDPFYSQYGSARGIPIIASARVSPKAITAARSMAAGMLAHRPDLAATLVRRGYRIAVMAQDEALLDLPEMRSWTKPARDDPRLTRCEIKHYDARIGRLTDRQYWDARARGIGGRHMVAAEEDLLGLPLNRYHGETIFVHEFSHQILDAIRESDRPLYARLEAAYANARATGLWRDEYTMTTIDEYWAEGSQFWFDSNRLQVFDGRRILNHPDLAAYDPALYAVLAAVYGESHHLTADPYWRHPARVPAGPPPQNTAEVC